MRLLAHSFAIALFVAAPWPASAQDADTTPTPRTGTYGFAPRAGPAAGGSGSAKAQLVSFGNYVTQFGVGGGGADVSEIEPGFSTFGFGMQGGTLNNRLADDFIVPTGEIWAVSDYRWIVYQTGAATTGTITGLNLNLWSTDPLLGGAPLASGPANSLLSQTWTGAYRVTSTTLLTTSRAMIEATGGALWTPSLTSGPYWLDASATGSVASGPWGPVRVPQLATDNARQFLGSSATWIAVTDALSLLPQDMLLAVNGTSSSSALTTYCTSKISSLGCAPGITARGTPDCNLPSGFVLTCGPVPGQSPGIFFYSTNGSIPPVVSVFGWRCVSGTGLFRVPLGSPFGGGGTMSGGTSGVCDGAYLLDFNKYLSVQMQDPALVCGATVDGQFWYRDVGNPGGANFSLAASFTMGLGGGPNPPTVSGFAPGSGGQGTVLTVTGSGFGATPGDLKILLANGIGFADVTSTAGGALTATVFYVGPTGTGPITVILGDGTQLPNQLINQLGIVSTSSQVKMLLNGAGTNSAGAYTLSPSSMNTVGTSIGAPLPGSLSLSMGTVTTGDSLEYRLAFKIGSRFVVFESSIAFTGTPDSNQRARHLAAHINASFGSQGVSASASGANVRISMAGATYGSVVVAGI